MGVEYGFAAVASLDANPFDIKRMFDARGLKITTWCAAREPARPASAVAASARCRSSRRSAWRPPSASSTSSRRKVTPRPRSATTSPTRRRSS
ncbi:MAG: hypothetical protein MZW92_61855 [Comamonadaceae bacterium]|nr:hypothetical protein [Comamonadaceae bacterium]